MVSLGKHLRGDLSLKLKTSISYNALVVNRYTGKEGEFRFVRTGSLNLIYAWVGGAWRSGSLV